MIDLSICIIVKDEEVNLDAALSSVKGCADEIVVVDTGSTDRTTEVAECHGARVHVFDPSTHPHAFFRDDEETCGAFGAPPPYSGDVMLGDFGAARRHSFSLAKGQFIYWMDADDVVEGAPRLREIVADMKARGLDIGFLPYDYARDHLGRTFYRQWRERVIRVGCASWVNPVHEVLLPSRAVQSCQYDFVTNIHRRKADRKSVPNRNYKILLRHFANERNAGSIDPRTLFYLGQEARFIEPQKALMFYEDYLRRSGWPEERAAAHMAIGQLLESGSLGVAPDVAYAAADREYATAAAEMPGNPDGLYGMARVAYHRQRWGECVAYTERARKLGNPESMLGANPLDRLYRPHAYYNHALFMLGRVEEAAASCREALAACPDDPGVPGGSIGAMKYNLAQYEAAIAARSAPKAEGGKPMIEFDKNEDVNVGPADIPRDALVIWGLQLWKQALYVDRDAAKAERLLQSMPASIHSDPAFVRMLEATKFVLDRVHHELNAPTITAIATDEADDADWLRRASTVVKRIPLDELLQKQHAEECREQQEFISRAVGYVKAGESKRKHVVFWNGLSVEPWDATTPNTTGIGGSETACIEMARELAALGHRVTVYGDTPHRGVKTFDGVEYRHGSEAQAPIECDVFISSRHPAVMHDPNAVRAKVKLLWVHDVGVGEPSAELTRWLMRFDRVLCLSQWHRSTFLQIYPFLDPSRIVVTRNGIDPGRFKQALDLVGGPSEDKRNHLVFSSSPNRGLPLLLHNFQFIRQQVPNAELHIYYGFDCWEKVARAMKNQPELDEIERYKGAIREAEARGGVHWHGRVSQRELADAHLRAKVWAYPTEFTETSCITAMEAQAAGALPVCTALAALSETVKHGVLLQPGPTYGPDFVNSVIRGLVDDEWRESITKQGRRWALENLSWAALAKEWSAMFEEVAQAVAANPLPAYVGAPR